LIFFICLRLKRKAFVVVRLYEEQRIASRKRDRLVG
jgi:hypothetical protein